MVHVGAEVAVLGGVVFYFHRKNSQLQELIVELAQANQKLSERVNGLEEDLNYLGQTMTAMQRRQTAPVSTPVQATPPVTPAVTPTTPVQQAPQTLTPEQVQQMMAMMQAQQVPQPQKPVQETFAPPEPAPEKTIIEPLQVYDNNDDLDKELASELADLQNAKVVCDGDTCTLVE